jgi:hypothetical protein
MTEQRVQCPRSEGFLVSAAIYEAAFVRIVLQMIIGFYHAYEAHIMLCAAPIAVRMLRPIANTDPAI